MCDSTGKINKEKSDWRLIGEEMKKMRISKKKTLRIAAKELKIDAISLSYMERGIIFPNAELYKHL
jgi:transcriptional regulator with XRE-family HTH domain